MQHFLFIHGTFGDSDDWLKTQFYLQFHADYTWDNILLPGHDERSPDVDSSLFEQMIQRVEAALDQPTIVVGYSLGGRVALHLTKRLQSQPNGPIRALVLEGAHPGIRDAAQRAQRAALDDQRAHQLREQGLRVFLDQWYQQPLFGPIAYQPAERAQLIERRVQGTDANHLARALEDCSPGRVPQLWDSLAEITCPMLYIHGEHDLAYQQVADEILHLRPQTARSVIADAGHNTHLDYPARFAWALHEFVKSTPELALDRFWAINRAEQPISHSSVDSDMSDVSATDATFTDVGAATRLDGDQRQTEERGTAGADADCVTPDTNEAQPLASEHAGPTPRSDAPTLRPELAPGRVVAWQQSPLVVLHKPSGVLVHNSAYAGPPEETLLDMAEAEIEERVFPLHRIDRGTSGIVIAVDQRERTTSWMPALRNEDSMREYIAIVRGHMHKSVRVERDIPNDKGVKLSAKSMFEPLACSPTERLSLVRVRIVTGRRHQIRRHCRSIKHPLIGDSTWGNSKLNRDLRERRGIDRLALHAWRVQFVGPDGQHYDLICPPDEAFQKICREVFEFESWDELAATEPLSEEMDWVHERDPDPEPEQKSDPKPESE